MLISGVFCHRFFRQPKLRLAYDRSLMLNHLSLETLVLSVFSSRSIQLEFVRKTVNFEAIIRSWSTPINHINFFEGRVNTLGLQQPNASSERTIHHDLVLKRTQRLLWACLIQPVFASTLKSTTQWGQVNECSKLLLEASWKQGISLKNLVKKQLSETMRSESESGKPCSVTTRISESEVNPRIRFLLRIWSGANPNLPESRIRIRFLQNLTRICESVFK